MKNPIELTIFLFDKKLAKLDVKQQDIPGRLTVSRDEIAAYREACSKGEDEEMELNATCIYLKSGETFIIDTTYNIFKKIMNEVN